MTKIQLELFVVQVLNRSGRTKMFDIYPMGKV